jgi:hypothetical protein
MKRLVLATLVLTLLATACSPPSAEDLVRGVAEQRRNYDATLQSWTQREDGSLYLDVLVVNNNVETSLRTLTVLVEQLDADDNVLSSTREALNVVTLTPGLGQGVGVTLAGAAAQVEGVRLFIEPLPDEEDWADFPEFDAVRPRI